MIKRQKKEDREIESETNSKKAAKRMKLMIYFLNVMKTQTSSKNYEDIGGGRKSQRKKKREQNRKKN